MVGVQVVPSGSPGCRVIGTAAPCGWLPKARASGGRDDRPSVEGAEQVWELTVNKVLIEGGWVLRGGMFIGLGDEAEWERGWVSEPARGRAERRW